MKSIDKGTLPLDTYHVDHLGPIPSTRKNYNHLFVVIDSFTKFTWIYPTKTTNAEVVIDRLTRQAGNFGNPRRIISDRGTAFTSNAFADYCKNEDIEHILIVTGVPRGNGQVERTNRIIIPVLTKLSHPNPSNWYKHVNLVQQYINSTYTRSIGMTPFQLLTGTNMKLKNDLELRQIIEQEIIEEFQEERNSFRDKAINNLQKIQEENQRTANSKRKKATLYKEGDLVAIKRTQKGPGLKLHPAFFGPCKIISVLRNDRYLVEKIGEHNGPHRTSTSADNMKRWPSKRNPNFDSDTEDSSNEDVA